ncbi:hypothetical protein, partial [Pseudomonas sp. VA159-2]|uniref:hypothetical protein n=1 Tax=Pseudomonas sp. VA159-2 TaxID=2956728 RepID=UPI00209786E6
PAILHDAKIPRPLRALFATQGRSYKGTRGLQAGGSTAEGAARGPVGGTGGTAQRALTLACGALHRFV